MRVVQLQHVQPVRRRRSRWWLVLPVVLLVAAAINILRPLPAPVATLSVALPATEEAPSLAWPDDGQAAIAAEGYGPLGTRGTNTPLATASIAKVITALCVLQKQPLKPGQAGPAYTIGTADVALYQHYADHDGSLLPVTAGEQLTEYQALQALMLPSANNIADSLVGWVFGSQPAYAAYATSFLHQNGLADTRVGSDASGFSPDTTSTAADLAKLGLLALRQPVLMEIASQASATLPVAGSVDNYNTVLGVNGITGLKTGNNDDDPGAFLFTANVAVGGQSVAVTGAVMDAASLDAALQSSAALVGSMQQGFEAVTVAPSGATVGMLKAPWGAAVPIKPSGAVELVRWKGTALRESYQFTTPSPNGEIGSLTVSAGQAKTTAKLQLAHPLAGPSFWWRLTRR